MWEKFKRWVRETFWVSEELENIVDKLVCATEKDQIQWARLGPSIGIAYYFDFKNLKIVVTKIGFDDYSLDILTSTTSREEECYESLYIRHLFKAIQSQEAVKKSLEMGKPDSEEFQIKEFKEWVGNLCP